MIKIRMQILAGLAVLVSVVSSYGWTCYVTASCTCVVAGSCYSGKMLPGCQVPTCLIADSTASVWNVCEGAGPYSGRIYAPPDTICCPSSCRAYNNCTQQYVSFSGAICCYSVPRYNGTGTCQ